MSSTPPRHSSITLDTTMMESPVTLARGMSMSSSGGSPLIHPMTYSSSIAGPPSLSSTRPSRQPSLSSISESTMPPRRSSGRRFEFKILLIGDVGVGKRALARYASGITDLPTDRTPVNAGVETFGVRVDPSVNLVNHTTSSAMMDTPDMVDLNMWVCAGHERFKTVAKACYHRAAAVMVAYDVANPRSFESLDLWFQDVTNTAPSSALCILVGCKCDLPNRAISQETAKAKASSLGVHLLETSSVSGHNVMALVTLVAHALTEGRRSRTLSVAAGPNITQDGNGGFAELLVNNATEALYSSFGGLGIGLRALQNTPPSAEATTTTTPQQQQERSAFTLCSLKCGAQLRLIDVEQHTLHECWLRIVDCGLGCGAKLSMLDCMAHERETCPARPFSLPTSVRQEMGFPGAAFLDRATTSSKESSTGSTTSVSSSALLHSNNPALPPAQPSSSRPWPQPHINVHSTSSSSSVDEPIFGNVQSLFVSGSESSSSHQYTTFASRPPLAATSSSSPLPSPYSLDDDTIQTKPIIEEIQDDDAIVLWGNLVSDAPNMISASGDRWANENNGEILIVPLSDRVVPVKRINFRELSLNPPICAGSGSFGSVYLGSFRGALVAVKRLHLQEIGDQDLLREAAVMASVSGHPHVLRFLGVCVERPNRCFVSEALALSLEEHLYITKGNHRESFSEICRFAHEAGSGLLHLHMENVVHRDVAARNLLLDHGSPRRVKVCDFGLARVLPPSVLGEGNRTMRLEGGSRSLEGPLKWTAPECLRPVDGQTKFSTSSDVFSFAVTIFELISRSEPFPMLDAVAAAFAVLDGARPPRSLMPKVVSKAIIHVLGEPTYREAAAGLTCLLEQAWAQDPSARPSMKEIVDVLTRVRASVVG